MTIYNRPDNSVFASGAKQEETGTFPDIERGWGVTESTNFIPPLEYFNAVQNRTDKAIAYLMQRGVAEWSAEMEYPKQAITILNGQVFFAKQQNTNKNPFSNPEIWVNSFAQKANVEDVYNKQEIDDLLGALGVKSINELRTIAPKKEGDRISVLSYYADTTIGGGEFVAIPRQNENLITIFDSATSSLSWKRVSEDLTIFDAGVKLGEDSTEAIERLESFNAEFDGLNYEILVNSKRIPALNVKRVAYKFNDISYPTSDFLGFEREVSQITKTPYYTAWTQDKTFVHDNVIYTPFMIGFGHRYDDMRIAMVRSFDNGQTWDTPTILVDYHPENPLKGYHTFSSGAVGNRMFMVVEERENPSGKLLNSYLYSRPLTITKQITGGISQVGNTVTINVHGHGLFVGDRFSVSTSGVPGVSGEHEVQRVIDANTFEINNSNSQTINNAGVKWLFAISFERNEFTKQELGAFNYDGYNATHIHSFTKVNSDTFLSGIHYGDGPRNFGFIKFDINWSTSTVTANVKYLTSLSRAVAEPCIKFYNGKVYISTRTQNPIVPALFIRCDLDGSNVESFNLTTTAIHYTPLPFVILDDEVYLFGTERAENEWETGNTDKDGNRYISNNPRTMLLKFNLSNFGQSEKVSTTCIYQGIYAGELVSSACGVGSVVEVNGKILYLFGDEDHRNSHSVTENARQADNAFIADGFQPDIYCLSLKVKNKTVQPERTFAGIDNVTTTIFRDSNGYRYVQCPMYYKSLVADKFLIKGNQNNVGLIGCDYLRNVDRLTISSTHKTNSSNGPLITMHNDKSDTPNLIIFSSPETRINNKLIASNLEASTINAGSFESSSVNSKLVRSGKLLVSSNAEEYGVIAADYSGTINKLYLSSTGSGSSKKGALITLHNNKSSKPKTVEVRAENTYISGTTYLANHSLAVSSRTPELRENEISFKRINDNEIQIVFKGSDSRERYATLNFS